MAFNKKDNLMYKILIGDFKIKHVQEYNYLGSLATDD